MRPELLEKLVLNNFCEYSFPIEQKCYCSFLFQFSLFLCVNMFALFRLSMGIRACFFLSCKVMTNSLYCDGLRTERTVTTDLVWNCWKSINISTGAIH